MRNCRDAVSKEHEQKPQQKTLSEADQEAVKALKGFMEGRLGFDFRRSPAVETARVAASTEPVVESNSEGGSTRGFIAAFEAAFGRRIILVRAKAPLPFQGLVLESHPDVLFVNVGGSQSAQVVMGHELVESLAFAD